MNLSWFPVNRRSESRPRVLKSVRPKGPRKRGHCPSRGRTEAAPERLAPWARGACLSRCRMRARGAVGGQDESADRRLLQTSRVPASPNRIFCNTQQTLPENTMVSAREPRKRGGATSILTALWDGQEGAGLHLSWGGARERPAWGLPAPAAFRILSSPLASGSLLGMCLGVGPSGFVLFGTLPGEGRFLSLILQTDFRSSLSSPSPVMQMFVHLMLRPRPPELSSFGGGGSFLSLLFRSGASCVSASESPTRSPASSNLRPIPPGSSSFSTTAFLCFLCPFLRFLYLFLCVLAFC